MKQNIKWVFFGTSEFSVIVLEELKAKGFTPEAIVTVEDKPSGRKLALTPPPVKVWAEKNRIPLFQFKTLKTKETEDALKSLGADVFVVASYGKLIPKNILDIPKYKTLNIHPSLLPKLRGPSPIQTAILEQNETGVTIIRLDTEMDHGPILTQKKIEIEWPPYADELERQLAKVGAEMLVDILPDLTLGKAKEVEQKHAEATFTKKIEKSDAELDLETSPEINLRKIRAFNVWPQAYFFLNERRIIIKKAKISEGKLILEKVIPEGKKEMNYEDFLRGQKN